MVRLWAKEDIVFSGSNSLAEAKTAAQLEAARARGGAVTAVLREPVARIVSMYYSHLEASSPLDDEHGFDKFLQYRLGNGNKGCRGTRLWVCLSNTYTKVLAGWTSGKPLCEKSTDPACTDDGVGTDALELAKRQLAAPTTVVAILEHMDAAPMAAYLARSLCYDEHAGVSMADRRRPRNPGFAKRDAYRDEAVAAGAYLPDNKTMSLLREMNALDAQLYEWAVEVVRERVLAVVGTALPPLPWPFPAAPPQQQSSS